MKRFTICGLRAFVDYVNDSRWLLESKCPRDAYVKVVTYIVQHNI